MTPGTPVDTNLPPPAPPAVLAHAGLESRGGYRAVLRNRLFVLVWAAQMLSQTAQNVVNFALVVEVERLTHSSANVGLVIVSFSLPALLLGPVAGVFVDRVSKRGVLLGTNVLRALLMVGFLLVPQSLEVIYGVTFLASAISQFFLPAEGAIIPLLVHRRELMTATSLFNITYTVAQVAGFVVIGPVLFKLFGPQALFIAVVVIYALAALCVAGVPQRERVKATLWEAVRRASHLGAIWTDMREVGRYLRAKAGLMAAFSYLALATALLMTLATLGPGFVARVLGLGPEDAGLVLAPAGAGMLLCTAALGHFATTADRRRLAGWGLVGMGISLAALALVRPLFERFQTDLAGYGPGGLPVADTILYLGLVGVITFSLGVEFSCVTVPSQTAVTEATDESIRGRMFAVLFMITGTVSALPALLIGALADNVGIIRVLLVVAVLVLLAGASGLARSDGAFMPRAAADRPR